VSTFAQTGDEARDVSRISTAAVADITITEADLVPPPAEITPWADASALSVLGDTSVSRVSLPEVSIASLVAPPSPLPAETTNSSISEQLPVLSTEADNVFDRTLRSATADTTLLGVCVFQFHLDFVRDVKRWAAVEFSQAVEK
jgi:hypothetical protein